MPAVAKKKRRRPPRPLVRLIIFGDPGGRKSTAAATFPAPRLVHSFDPPGKEMPYLQAADVDEIEYTETPEGMQAVDCYNADGKLVQRVEYYHDADPSEPDNT